MCGIVAAASQNNVVNILADGLKHLEYRGYDSAGIAVIENKNLHSYKKEGHVSELTSILDKDLASNIGIAHTRWATHGKPSEANAHPHISENNIAIVHNGIIENYVEIKEKFFKNIKLESETDSEVLAHLINFYAKDKNILDAVHSALNEVKGAYAIAVLDKNNSKAVAFGMMRKFGKRDAKRRQNGGQEAPKRGTSLSNPRTAQRAGASYARFLVSI